MQFAVGPHNEPFVFSEVIASDCYGIRKLYRDVGDVPALTIVDFGANIGTFSLMAACLFPCARRIAIEAAPDTFEVLKQNLSGLKAECCNIIMGDGRKMTYDVGCSHGSRMFSHNEGGVTSRRFSDIMKQLCVQPPFIVKMDCEGAEMSLLDDPEAPDILKQSMMFVGEGHFNQRDDSKDRWDVWVSKHFKETHYLSVKSAGEYVGYDMVHFSLIAPT